MVYYDSELKKLQKESLEKERLDAQLTELLVQQEKLKKRTAELKHQKLEEQRTALESQQKEVEETICAGVRACDISQQLLGELESAKNWGTWDVIGGGLLTDMAKYEKLNHAQELAQELQNALRNFRTELADVKEEISGDIQLNIGDFLHFADYFFDDIFSDWMVLDKISASKGRAEKTYDQIQKILRRLQNLKNTVLNEQNILDRKIEAIVTGTEL